MLSFKKIRARESKSGICTLVISTVVDSRATSDLRGCKLSGHIEHSSLRPLVSRQRAEVSFVSTRSSRALLKANVSGLTEQEQRAADLLLISHQLCFWHSVKQLNYSTPHVTIYCALYEFVPFTATLKKATYIVKNYISIYMKLYIVYLLVIVNYRLFFGFFECLGVYFLCLFFYFYFFTSTHKLTFL